MPQHAAAEIAASNRRRGQAADGVSFWHTLYLGTSRYNMAPGTADPPADALFPMAFLVEQDPGSTASAHFHQSDQFQVVVAGGGTLGLHEVAPLTVHFTAAHTAYGPIRAGAEGVSYFTLRNGFDPGARFMSRSENRAALRSIEGRRHREAVAGPLPPASSAREVLIGPDPDGMAAWRYRLPAGERVLGPDPAAGRGQYWLVCDGSLVRGSETLRRLSCVFVASDEPAFEPVAGPDGLEILALQFPRRPNA
ncbi:MAG: hypothetical protein J0H19_11615 [Rhodospirillales bacterium]|nr:hypothetical protein [Rhodospirillales bacterium]